MKIINSSIELLVAMRKEFLSNTAIQDEEKLIRYLLIFIPLMTN